MNNAPPPPTETPCVAVLLVNWNGRDVTLDCLRTLAEVDYSNRLTIVVDNASTDGSVEAIRVSFPDVVVLEQPRNLRFAGGNNAGMRYALEHGAGAVLLLNNDTTVDPLFLQRMVARMQTDARCGMVAPKIYYYGDPRRIWFAGGELSFWTGTMKHTGIREPDAGQHDTPGETAFASGCCMLVSRELIERVGVLDESYFIYTEDVDWCMRARRTGFRILYEPDAHVWHKLSVSAGGHLSYFKLKNKFLSNFRFFSRYARWYHWLVFPWMNILVNIWAAAKYLGLGAAGERSKTAKITKTAT